MPAAFEVNAFRFYADDGDEDESSALGAQDANITVDAAGSDVIVHLRCRVDETASSDGAGGDTWVLEYEKNATGGFKQIKNAPNSPLNVMANSGSLLTDAGATTNRSTEGISDPGGLTFQAGQQNEDATTVYWFPFQHLADKFSEHVWALELISADLSDGDTLDFRFKPAGELGGGGTLANNVVPRITISGGGDTNINATVDALTLVEFSASITLDVEVAAGVDALTLAEQAATITLDVEVLATTDALTLAEFQAIVALGTNIAAGVDNLTLAEHAATITYDVNVLAGFDALIVAEFSATVLLDIDITATTDALTLAEFQATVDLGFNIAAGVDALVLAEHAAAITLDVNVGAGVDTLTLAEFQAVIDSVVPGVFTTGITKGWEVRPRGRQWNVRPRGREWESRE